MRVLVMGGTQFNGLALVHELAQSGHEVTILNRGQSEAQLPIGIHRVFADRTDAAQMREVLGAVEVDAVIDVSAYRPEDVQLMVDIFRGRIAHYVFISSTVIYAATDLLPISEDHPVERGADQNDYGMNKLLCEDILIREWRENRFPASIVALSMVMGSGNILPDREQRMFQRILQERPILIPGDGSTVQQIGHADDQARALEMMLANPITFGERYNLTGGDYFTQEQILGPSFITLNLQRRTPDKIIPLIQLYGKTKPGFKWRIFRPHVMTPVPIAHFRTTGIECKVPGQLQIMPLAGLQHTIQYSSRLFSRKIKLPSQFADKAESSGQEFTLIDSNGAGTAKRKTTVTKVSATEALQ